MGARAQAVLVVRPGNKPLAESARQAFRVVTSMEDLL